MADRVVKGTASFNYGEGVPFTLLRASKSVLLNMSKVERYKPITGGIMASVAALAALVIPEVLRYMILVNLLVVVVCWILDYCSFVKIAGELNGGVKKGQYLVVDIQECPKSVEDFCGEIESYCKKNRIRYEFITRGKPAEILMGGERYWVELDSFYSQFDPMYALKFKEIAKGSVPFA